MKKPLKIERIEVPAPFSPGSTNCYYISGSSPTLIDPGVYSPDAFRSLQTGLRELGSDIGDIRRIILTHAHSDHAGLAGALAAHSGADVFVHRLDENRMRLWSEKARQEWAGELRAFFLQAGVPEKLGIEVSEALVERFRRNFSQVSDMVLLEGGEVFSFDHFELKVLHTPGHTAGSVCLFCAPEGLLLAGDTLHEKIVPYLSPESGTTMGHSRYFALEQCEQSLDLLGALPVRAVLPGHGSPSSKAPEMIEGLKRKRIRRRRRILEILRSGSDEAGRMSQFEILERLFLGASRKRVLYMGIAEVRGCLDLVEDEGLVEVRLEGGRKLYRLKG